MITQFGCSNYRNINIHNLEFAKINILIGPNNSGKSNFIKALSFASDMMTRNAIENGSRFLSEISANGWDDLLNRKNYQVNGQVDFHWCIDVSEKILDYQLKFHTGSKSQDFYITNESIKAQTLVNNLSETFCTMECHNDTLGKGVIYSSKLIDNKNNKYQFDLNNQETVLAQFQKILLNNGTLYNTSELRDSGLNVVNTLTDYFERFYIYSSSNCNFPQLRQYANIHTIGNKLFADGSNLINVLSQRSSENPDIINAVAEKMNLLIPALTDMVIIPRGSQLQLKLKIDNQWYDLSEMSDGTLRALIFILLLFTGHTESDNGQDEFNLIAFDEPENNMHPAWLQFLAKWILESDNFEQCFISTHSPDLLDGFTDSFVNGNVAVFVFNPNSKEQIRRCSYQEIKQDLDGWELGDLYRSGDPALGGWPI